MLRKWLNQIPYARYELAGVELWLWIVLPGLFISAFAISRLVVALVMSAFQHIGRKKVFVEHYIVSLSNPISLFFTGVLFNSAMPFLPLDRAEKSDISSFNAALFTLSVTWGMLIFVNNLCETMHVRLLTQGRYSAAGMIPLLRKIMKTSIAILALLFLLQNWGFDVAALIAALGIGGIAIALASQKSVENLFGGIMISLDQPIRVGEFGNFGNFVGTVEDIGLRSTSIRTLDRTVVSIPNAEMASMRIETFAPRDKFLYKKIFTLRYETSADQMRFILIAFKELLLAHPMVEKAPARPRFLNFGTYGLEVEVFAYVKTSDNDTFLEVQEDLNLRIKGIVEQAGSGFAFPSQIVYMERSHGLNRELQQSVDEQIDALRKAHKLEWPNPSSERVKEITDTLEWPPQHGDNTG